MKLKSEWFKDGVDNQKTPSSYMSLKRPDLTTVKQYSVEQKKSLLKWLNLAKIQADIYFKEMELTATDVV